VHRKKTLNLRKCLLRKSLSNNLRISRSDCKLKMCHKFQHMFTDVTYISDLNLQKRNIVPTDVTSCCPICALPFHMLIKSSTHKNITKLGFHQRQLHMGSPSSKHAESDRVLSQCSEICSFMDEKRVQLYSAEAFHIFG
jgi:hypothetical protein